MRKTYLLPRSNVGIGGFITGSSGVRYHVPSWTVVEKDTTIEDIVMEKRPFEELFEEEKSWKFTSARSGEEYIVRYNARNELCCTCWGYIAHGNCKHIKEVKLNEKIN